MTPQQSVLAAHLDGARWYAATGWSVYIRDLDGRDYEVACVIEDATLLRQIERLEQRVIDSKPSQFDGLSAIERKYEAWTVLADITTDGMAYYCGTSLFFTEWDVEMIGRFKRLLDRIYEANKAPVDAEAERLGL